MPAEITSEVRKYHDFQWKIESKIFPTVYDNPILLNIGMPYTVGKLLNPPLQCFGPVRGTQTCHRIFTAGVPARIAFML